MNIIILIIILILIFTIILSIYKWFYDQHNNSERIYINANNNKNKNKKPKKILSFNTALIPIQLKLDLVKKKADIIASWILNDLPNSDIDVIVFQEMWTKSWTNNIYNNLKKIGWNIIYQPNETKKPLSSGLLLATPLPVKNINMASYENCSCWDCLADKGFISAEIGGINIFNTHLQDDSVDFFDVRSKQLESIISSATDSKLPVVIIGDFNIKVKNIDPVLTHSFQIIYDDLNSYDWALTKGLPHNIKCIRYVNFDGLSDHYAIEFIIDN